VLTLLGPKATTCGHTVDFRGRLTPAAEGAQVRLYSGSSYVNTTRLRADGSYHFRVSVGRPGPFKAVVGTVSSRPVTVRVHPFLHTELTGSRIAGERLAVAVRLEPPSAGRVHVRVLRSGELAYGRLVTGSARIRLNTRSLEPMRVAIESLPTKGSAGAPDSVRCGLRAPTLSYGSSGPLVAGMLDRLSDLGYVTPSPRTTFDGDVQQSVYAFQKAQRLERTGVADDAFWRRLARPVTILPRFPAGGDHLEIDKTRQVLLKVRGGRVAQVIPVSTGGIAGYYTPEGRFAIGRKIPGYDRSPLGVLYKPMYFVGGWALHGNPSVPPYPASPAACACRTSSPTCCTRPSRTASP
jgi:peptidoglycan hydrolase-like protein with peptidoglycan-binding domain